LFVVNFVRDAIFALIHSGTSALLKCALY